MLNIYLVRHGQDTDNVSGILNGHRDNSLTVLGLSQAHDLAEFIGSQKLKFIKVYSSPLKRAYQTASVITDTLSLSSPEILPDLIERDFGAMTGKNVSEIDNFPASSLIKTETVTYFLEAPGAENFPQVYARAQIVLKFLEEKYQTGNILLVSHGDIGKMIYAAYYNLPWEDVLKMFHFGNSELLLLALGIMPEKAKIFAAPQFNN